MAAFLGNLRNTMIMGFVAAALILAVRLSYGGLNPGGKVFWVFIVHWAQVLCGVMWIGLLWYFNFVAAQIAPRMPAALRPALDGYITPVALFWLRWSALGAIVFGLLLAALNGHLAQVLSLDSYDDAGPFKTVSYLLAGIGVWLGLIMGFNVWFLIWPNQQRALAIGGYSALSAPDKAVAVQTAGLYSRINMLLSIPMLFCVVAALHIP